MKHKIAAAAAAFGVALVSLSVPAGAAMANNESSCGASKMCIFADADYWGFLGSRSGGQGIQNVSSGANDKMSSWINRSSVYTGAWYNNANGDASMGCFNMRTVTKNNYVGNPFNDRMSSWRTNTGC